MRFCSRQFGFRKWVTDPHNLDILAHYPWFTGNLKMTKSMRFDRRFTALIALALSLILPGIALGQETAGINVHGAWARENPLTGRNGAAYMVLENTGSADFLIGAQSSLAERVEVHTHIMDGDIMRMRKLDELTLAKGEVTTLAPGGHHLMMFDLKSPLVPEHSFPLMLLFKSGKTIEVDVEILSHKQAMDKAKGPASSQHH